MSRYLFVLWAGGGNVPPQLAIAGRLVERGHDVAVLAPQCLANRVAETGCRHLPYRRAPEHDHRDPARDLVRDFEARTPIGAAKRVRDRLMFGPLDAFAADVAHAIDTDGFDVVVPDYCVLGAALAAERAGLPVAPLVHSIPPFPAAGVPPFGTGFQPRADRLGQARDRLFTRLLVRFYTARLDRLNQVRSDMGLPARRNALDQFLEVDRILVLTSAAFDFPAEHRPANLRYVGAQLEPAPPPHDRDDVPLVLVSLSTIYQAQERVLRRIIAALEELPIRAVVTTGETVDPASFPSSEKITVTRWTPHRELLPHTAAVVTHAGHGTALTSLAHGVPLVCLPMGRDQPDIAARVVWHDAGIRLSANSRTRRIAATIHQVIDDPRYRLAAGRLARMMAEEHDDDAAVRELELLAATRAGLP